MQTTMMKMRSSVVIIREEESKNAFRSPTIVKQILKYSNEMIPGILVWSIYYQKLSPYLPAPVSNDPVGVIHYQWVIQCGGRVCVCVCVCVCNVVYGKVQKGNILYYSGRNKLTIFYPLSANVSIDKLDYYFGSIYVKNYSNYLILL